VAPRQGGEGRRVVEGAQQLRQALAVDLPASVDRHLLRGIQPPDQVPADVRAVEEPALGGRQQRDHLPGKSLGPSGAERPAPVRVAVELVARQTPGARQRHRQHRSRRCHLDPPAGGHPPAPGAQGAPQRARVPGRDRRGHHREQGNVADGQDREVEERQEDEQVSQANVAEPEQDRSQDDDHEEEVRLSGMEEGAVHHCRREGRLELAQAPEVSQRSPQLGEEGEGIEDALESVGIEEGGPCREADEEDLGPEDGSVLPDRRLPATELPRDRREKVAGETQAEQHEAQDVEAVHVGPDGLAQGDHRQGEARMLGEAFPQAEEERQEEDGEELRSDDEAVARGQEGEDQDREDREQAGSEAGGGQDHRERCNHYHQAQAHGADDPGAGVGRVEHELEEPVRVDPAPALGDVRVLVVGGDRAGTPDLLARLEVPAEVRALDVEEAERRHQNEEAAEGQPIRIPRHGGARLSQSPPAVQRAAS